MAVTILAVGLRFFRLGDWSFDSDETFTLRDSLAPRLSNPRPLLFFLNYGLIRPLMALDEFGLRFLPAFFGVLAIPTFYWATRRLVGNRAALLGAILLAVNPLHVYYSQFARYWSLVLLLSLIYSCTLYVSIRERNPRGLVLGIVTAVVAALAHPTSVLLVGGLVLWLAMTYWPETDLRQLWQRRPVRQGVASAIVLGVVIVVWFIPLLRGWITQHDAGQGTEFLLHLPGTPGLKQAIYLASYVESLTLPLVVAAIFGMALLWQEGNRSLGLYLACLAAFPAAFLSLLSLRTPVSTFYLVPSIPVFFIGAGVFLDRLADLDWLLRPRWLLSAAFTAVIIASGTPTLVSQYRDGRRYDYRGVAQWLGGQLRPGDQVISDQPKALVHYLPNVKIGYLHGNPAPLDTALRTLRETTPSAALWVIAPAPAHAFRANPKLRGLQQWMYEHCQLRNTVGVGRVDLRQYYLQVFRCPPSTEEIAPARATSETTSE